MYVYIFKANVYTLLLGRLTHSVSEIAGLAFFSTDQDQVL